MAIFRFFKMAATAILDFLNIEILAVVFQDGGCRRLGFLTFKKIITVRKVKRFKLHHHAKFHGYRSNRF